MRRSALKRGKGLRRTNGFKQPSPPPKALPPSKAPITDLPRVMWGETARRGRCVMCGARRPEGHHVIPKRWLKNEGLHEFLWDRRNMMRLCDDCHDNHEAAAARIPREKLTEAHHAFIAEVGLDPWPAWLERTYPHGEEDRRP